MFQQIGGYCHFFLNDLVHLDIVDRIFQAITACSFSEICLNFQIDCIITSDRTFFWQTSVVGIEPDSMDLNSAQGVKFLRQT